MLEARSSQLMGSLRAPPQLHTPGICSSFQMLPLGPKFKLFAYNRNEIVTPKRQMPALGICACSVQLNIAQGAESKRGSPAHFPPLPPLPLRPKGPGKCPQLWAALLGKWGSAGTGGKPLPSATRVRLKSSREMANF